MTFSKLLAEQMLDTSTAAVDNRMANLYRRLQLKSWFSRLFARLTGRSNEILSLETTLQHQAVNSSHYGGLRVVPIAQIQGSEARTHDFDRRFNPVSGRTLMRWVNVARARLMDLPLPPVELIEVGGAYYVRDGHHRVSVAHAFGEDYIEAEITIWEVADQATRFQPVHTALR